MLKSYSLTVVINHGKQKNITVLARTVQEARKLALDTFGRDKVAISKILAE